MKRLLAGLCVFSLASPVARADKWPQGGKPTTHAKLAKRVSSAVKRGYKLERRNTRSGKPTAIGWTGPDVGLETRVVAGSASQQLSEAGLTRAKEAGRSPMDVIIDVALGIGAEQGKRLLKHSPSMQAALRFAKMAADSGNPASMKLAAELLEIALDF